MMENTQNGIRVVIYARVSTEEQREGLTINSQIAELERFARDKTWTVAGIYKDDGWSGSVIGRPALDRLRDDARGCQFQAVLINDVDRLARDVAHLGVIKRDLEKHGLRVIFRKLPSETGPISNLMVNILGSFAEFERELIIDRTRRGRRHKVEGEKKYLGSITAYGYRYHVMDRTLGKDGRLEVEPYEAGVVRLMFEWVDGEGLSARRVARRLNERLIIPRKADRWGTSSVLRILHNEMYAGLWHYNKLRCCEPEQRRVKTTYPKRVKSSVRARPRQEWIPLALPEPLKLVARDRWERVQRRIKRNICFSPRNEKHFYLLKGLIRCGGCGKSFIGDCWHGRFYYRCSARCKRLPAVRDYRLNDIVVDAVETLVTENLKSLEPEQRREALRRVIQDAIFDGSAVTIRQPEMAGGHNITDSPSERPSIS
jgi:site-specific DNA recombinase